MKLYRQTWANINLSNLMFNIATLKKHNSKYKYYFGVVKANAYGHGDLEISKALIKSGINYLAVSSLEEALPIRQVLKEIPIICLEPIAIDYIKEAAKNNITITVCDYEYAQELISRLENKIKVHLKLDTGMNRLGIKTKADFMKTIKLLTNKNVDLEGLYTHMATATSDKQYYEEQIENFKVLVAGINLDQFKIIHLGNSAAFLNYDLEKYANGIRLGLCMYGINNTNQKICLKPVLSLYSKIIQINKQQKGDKIGYDNGYVCKKDEYIAVVPIGYADGILRENTGRTVLIKKQPYKIVGNICMDMLFIKVAKNIKVGDQVTFIGDQITVAMITKHLNGRNHAVLCALSDRVSKYYILAGKIIAKENRRHY